MPKPTRDIGSRTSSKAVSLASHQQKQLTQNTGSALTIFDIDDTLFRTFARVEVRHKHGHRSELTPTEFNSYQLSHDEEFDFTQFQDARLFHATSKPIENIWKTAQNTLDNIGKRPGSRVVIVTARQDLDDTELFIDTFRKHGLDMDKISVHAVGGASNKKPLIREMLLEGSFTEARLFDDYHQNLLDFLSLKEEMPHITFKAFPVAHSGKISKPIIS